MSDQDELLFGTGREPVRDSDGDGVSDGQVAVDGTDPNDANSSVRHDLPSLDPSLDPRGDLRQVTLGRETTIDVTKNLPEEKSLEQNLPKGMDGEDIPIGQNPDDGGPGRLVISPMGGADVVTGMGPGAPTDGPGRPGPGSTIAAGDDDDLEELEVERYVAPDADQIDHPEDYPPGAGTVGIIIPDVGIIIPDVGIIIPDFDRPFGDDIVPVPLDPVADAMPSHLDMDQHEVPQGGFDVLEVDHALAAPDEIDLDDGF